MLKSKIFEWKLRRATNKLLKAKGLIEANGYSVVKIEEAGGSFYLRKHDGSLWRLKAAK